MATIGNRLSKLERELKPDDQQIRIYLCGCNRDDGKHNPGCMLYGLREEELKTHHVVTVGVDLGLL